MPYAVSRASGTAPVRMQFLIRPSLLARALVEVDLTCSCGYQIMKSSSSNCGLTALTFALLLSQFFRTCLGVMAPEVQVDLQLSLAGFGALSSCFFIAFGLAQIPVGIAFDRFGVGAPTRLLLLLGVLSAMLFVLACSGIVAMLAQVGLGLACAPIFMGLMHYAAERLSPRAFATFISRANALGMLGGMCATAPLGWAVQTVGWRPAIAVGGFCMGCACIAVWRFVRDEGQAQVRQESLVGMLRISITLLRFGAMWTLIPMCVAMAAGTAFRNAWGGPYFADLFQLQAAHRGLALAVLSLGAFLAAMLLPLLVRRYSIRYAVLLGTCITLTAGSILTVWPAAGLVPDVAMLATFASIGVLHPLVMTHGRMLLAPAVRGRGLGILNSFYFLGSALTSWAFGQIADAGHRASLSASTVYGEIFAVAALFVSIGLLAYRRSPAIPSAVIYK